LAVVYRPFGKPKSGSGGGGKSCGNSIVVGVGATFGRLSIQ